MGNNNNNNNINKDQKKSLSETELKSMNRKGVGDTQNTGINDENDASYSEDFPNVFSALSHGLGNCCSVKTIKRRLPILEWLPKYEKSFFLQDAVAGLSVGLTAIPQGIAYAVVAGLSPEYGLYSGFMGCFVYTFFGSCKDITIGPTAIMSLMIYSAVKNLNNDFAVLGTFLSGGVIFLLGILNLGFLVQFISTPTIIGFTTSATITIASGQVKPLLGIKSGNSNEFIASWENVFKHLDEIEVSDTILGLISIVILMLLKKPTFLSRWPVFSKYISISRNAIVVIVGMIVAYIFHVNGSDPFRLTGSIKEGLPPFTLPPTQTELNGEVYYFADMVRALGLSLITLPLVSILETIAIAKSFSKGKVVDATQEMIAVGLCNIASSFFLSIPITGSFTRTAVNHNSGVKTTLGGVITGCLVLLALGLLTGTFYFIPKTTLAAVIIAAMASMIELHEIFEIYRTKRADIIPFLSTFIVSLLYGLEFGILAGIAASFVMTLYTTSRPQIEFELARVNDVDVLIVTPDQSLSYSSAEYFKSTVIKRVTREFSSAQYIMINGVSITKSLDVTVVKNLSTLMQDLAVYEKKVMFWNWKREAFHLVMRHNKEYFDLFKFGSLSEAVVMQVKDIEQNQLSDISVN